MPLSLTSHDLELVKYGDSDGQRNTDLAGTVLPNMCDLIEYSNAPTRIVYRQNNRIIGNNKQLNIHNGHFAAAHEQRSKFSAVEIDSSDKRDINHRWHHVYSLDPAAPVMYEQNNWIFGANDILTISNGPLTVLDKEMQLYKYCTQSDASSPKIRIEYVQNNWVYGDNAVVNILNGAEGESVRGSTWNIQKNWVYGENAYLNTRCGNDLRASCTDEICREESLPSVTAFRPNKRSIEESSEPRKRTRISSGGNELATGGADRQV